MAMSPRDVVTASVFGFIAWAIVLQWIPILRFVPYALIAGAAIALSGSALLAISTSRGRIHGRHKLLHNTQYLAFASPTAWAAEKASLKERAAYNKEPLYPSSLAVSQNLDQILNLVLRDFVSSWYTRISSSPSFTNEIDRAVRAALGAIRDKAEALDLVELGVTRILPILNGHIKSFYDAERMVRGKNLSRDVTESEELDMAIARKYQDGRLHSAVALTASNTKALQQQHLRELVGKIVPQCLPAQMTTSRSVLVLIREIISSAVLLPVMQVLTDPDVLNQMIEAFGRSVLHDRKTVRKLRAALDEISQPRLKMPPSTINIRIAPGDSERKFEKFIRAVRLCNNLPDARRFRSEVARQLKRDSALGGMDSTYLRRLDAGKRLLDQRVAQLSSDGSNYPDASPQPLPKGHENSMTRQEASLQQVLYDAAGLSYFMEYMDRLNLMSLVQFWIVVDGIRSPLEQDIEDPTQVIDSTFTWGESEREDLAQISEAYLRKPELKISETSLDTVNTFLKASRRATSQQYIAARHAILAAQVGIFTELKENHFPNFKKSDLFFKWIASDDVTLNRPSIERASSDLDESQSARNRKGRTGIRNSLSSLKGQDLRRAIASSSDLTTAARKAEGSVHIRRSLDEPASRAPLFGEDDDADPLAMSTHSLDSNMSGTIPSNGNQTPAVDAVQAALNDLIDEPQDNSSLFSEQSLFSAQDTDSMRNSIDIPRHGSPSTFMDGEKPSLASLGLLGTPSRRTVFSDNDLFGEDEKLWEEGQAESDANENLDDDPDNNEIHEAAPGDLGLAELIQSLSTELDKLEGQQSIVEALTRKAELTNNTAELRILRKSKTSLEREIHRKQLQKQQYMIQESDNSLYGKANVFIKSVMVGTEEDGHEFALYVVEVQRQSGENMVAATWIVTRRFSEFHELHRRLRARFPSIRNLDFPRRQMVPTLQKDFLKKRRFALEKYLRELLQSPNICRSLEFRAFLSQHVIRAVTSPNGELDKQDFISRIYNSVTDGMEEFLGNIPVLDQLSLAGQNLISAATSMSPVIGQGSTSGNLPSVIASDPFTAAEAEREIHAFETPRDPEIPTFIQPICDIFLEIFELNRGNNWLRGRAVVVVVQQLLGGTIERRVRDAFRILFAEDSLLRYLDMAQNTMWPCGKLRATPPVRTEQEKAQSRREAGLVLATLLPDLAGGVVGRGNAAKAGRRIFATLSNERLNLHLAYCVLDEIVEVLFGIRPGQVRR